MKMNDLSLKYGMMILAILTFICTFLITKNLLKVKIVPSIFLTTGFTLVSIIFLPVLAIFVYSLNTGGTYFEICYAFLPIISVGITFIIIGLVIIIGSKKKN